MSTPVATTSDPAKAIAALLDGAIAPDGPGAAVIVAQHGEVIFRQGYGMANLELGVPIEPHMVFRLGSITKQFTAVAVLILAEEGKLALDDEITRFLPDYPTHGQRITVEHLLTHTSGIKSYTEMPEWLPLWRKDLTLTELIDIFKDQPMVFAPGERWAYNNSGYVLLGAIIEAASGQSYEQFLDERIFKPLGMIHSGYDHTERVIPGRVSGYQQGQNGLENATFLSMTQPHAAGALISSVDDLARWDEALYTGRPIPAATLQRAFTPARLNDGTETGYGYGWAIWQYQGHPVIEHGGGIPGFITDAIRLPDDHLFVAVLTNSTLNDPAPDMLAFRIAAEVIGHPYVEPAAIAIDPADLDRFVGEYVAPAQDPLVVIREEDQLFLQGRGPERQALKAASPTEFFYKQSLARLRFEADAGGAITALRIEDRYGPATVATRTDPAEHSRP